MNYSTPRFLCFVLLLSAFRICNSQYAQFETKSRLVIDNRGYEDLVVAIGDSVDENDNLIDKLKSVLTDFSRYLHSLTGLYIRQVRILVPESWQPNPLLYKPVTWETFENSDIRIDHIEDGDDTFAHAPYTNKPSPCGAPGRYIHLSPTFILDSNMAMNFGGYDKVLVREWAKYRWGVFEESPDGNDPYFYASSTGDIEGTRCSKERRGTWKTATGEICNPTLPGSEDCLFVDTDIAGSGGASIMYRQYLRRIDQFCEDEGRTNIQEMLHNIEAPNQQNRQCDRKSIMQVLREHSDIRTARATVRWMNPNFDVIRRSVEKVVLVLDRSSSMKNYNRLSILRQAAYNFITRVIPDEHRLGIVQFNDKSDETDIKSPLRVINDQSRLDLLIAVPDGVNGGTSIGAGVRNGLKVLAETPNGSPAGGRMILITDGEETRQPNIERLLNEDRRTLSNVTIHTIAVGPEADSNLEALANFTNGRHFHHADSSTTLFDVFSQFGFDDTARTSSEIFSSSFSIASESLAPVAIEVNVDSSIEGDVLFLIGADSIESLVVTIQRPDRTTITAADTTLYTRVSDFELIKVKTNDVMYGVWTIFVTNRDTKRKSVSVVVEGGVSRTSSIITVEARWAVGELTPPNAQTLFVTVSKGYLPVAGANVTAAVSHDNGTVETRLWDDGVGADLRANDGIYSRYITKFDGAGRYGAKVFVSGVSGVTKILGGRRLGSAAPTNILSQSAGSRTDVETGVFQRVVDGGSFKCSHSCQEGETDSLYGPAKVTDLRVENFNKNELTANLVFTAPGGDLMDGRATSYSIRWAKSFEELHENFERNLEVERHAIPNSVYYTTATAIIPKLAREREVITVHLPDLGNFSYVFALRATDQYGMASPISNFASVSAKSDPFIPGPTPVSTGTIMQPPNAETTTMLAGDDGNALDSTLGKNAGFPWYIILVALLAIILFLLFLLLFVSRRRATKETDESTVASPAPSRIPEENAYNSPGIPPTVSSTVRYSSYIGGTNEYNSVSANHLYEDMSLTDKKVQPGQNNNNPPSYEFASGIPSPAYATSSSKLAQSPPSYAFASGIPSPAYGLPSSNLKRNPSLDRGEKSKVAFGASVHGDDVNSAYEFVRQEPNDGSSNQYFRHSAIISDPYKPHDETGVKRASVAENNTGAAGGSNHKLFGVQAQKDDTKEASVKTRGEKASKGKLPPK